jgi:hypothetical protein
VHGAHALNTLSSLVTTWSVLFEALDVYAVDLTLEEWLRMRRAIASVSLDTTQINHPRDREVGDWVSHWKKERLVRKAVWFEQRDH